MGLRPFDGRRSAEDGPPAADTSIPGSLREGIADAHAAEQNLLLASIPLDEYDVLLTALRPARLDFKARLIEPDVPITDVWFVRTGAGSMLATRQEGGGVEVATIGREGFIGVPILHGVDRSAYEVIMQIAGDGWRVRADTFRRLIDELPGLRAMCMRYAQYFSDQMAQSVACNRLHTLEERCARWLLATRDRVDSDRFELIQEFMALMLGVRRAGVSVAMGILQRNGIIQYTRGAVTIIDRAGLEQAACDCYEITRQALLRTVKAEL